MNTIQRRTFLSNSTKSAIGLSAFSISTQARPVLGANEKFTMTLVGMGGRGQSLAKTFARDPRIQLAYMCDPHTEKGEQVFQMLKEQHNPKLKRLVDFRETLDDESVDAVIVATPDHWHALATIWACQAGKDVYVEKPACHTIWEGRQMVKAARKYKRVVQVGTQSRSAPYMRKAIDYLRSGQLGSVHLCKVFNIKSGRPYHKSQSSEHIEFDLWAGPASLEAAKNIGGKGWLFVWDFSNGDMMSDGIHQIDLARWLIGKEYPTKVHSDGGNFAYDDDREVPDTQLASLTYGDMMVSFNMTQYTQTMSKTPMDIRQSDKFPHWPTNSTRIELYGSDGVMIVGRHGGGWQVMGKDGEILAQEYGRFPDVKHKDNFVECMISREKPNADIEEGHKSCLMVHAACIAYRMGGEKLDFNASTETFEQQAANEYLKRDDRKPFVIPETV